MRYAGFAGFLLLFGLVIAYSKVAWATGADPLSVDWLVVLDDWVTRVVIGLILAVQIGPKLLDKMGLSKPPDPPAAPTHLTENQIRAVIQQEIHPVVVERDAQHRRVNEKIDGLQKEQEKAVALQHAWQLEVSQNIGKLMGKLGVE